MRSDYVITIVLALFGGIGATVIWEGLVGPWQTRRNLARALQVEISLNLQLLAFSLAERPPARSLPVDLLLSTVIFKAVLDKLPNFPLKAYRYVFNLYSKFDYLNSLQKIYSEAVDRLRSAPEDSKYRVNLQNELDQTIDAFYRVAKATYQISLETQKTLYPIGEHMRFRKEPFKIMSKEEFDERLSSYRDRRNKGLEALRMHGPSQS
jgi:hypothetical protein